MERVELHLVEWPPGQLNGTMTYTACNYYGGRWNKTETVQIGVNGSVDSIFFSVQTPNGGPWSGGIGRPPTGMITYGLHQAIPHDLFLEDNLGYAGIFARPSFYAFHRIPSTVCGKETNA